MKRMRWLVALVLGLTALAGCTTPGGRVAATVDGVPIGVDRIENPVRTIGNTEGELAEPHGIVLSYAIRALVARQVAGQRNIPLTGQPRAEVLTASPNLARFADDPQVKSFVDDVVDASIVSKVLGDAAFLQRLQQAKVQVNPRYGSWAIDAGAVSPTGGQLSQPWNGPSTPVK